MPIHGILLSSFSLVMIHEQFIYDLPARLGKCIKTEAYADAVRFYTGAMPIFKVPLGISPPQRNGCIDLKTGFHFLNVE